MTIEKVCGKSEQNHYKVCKQMATALSDLSQMNGKWTVSMYIISDWLKTFYKFWYEQDNYVDFIKQA